MSDPERSQAIELLKSVNGLAIMTKTMSSSCPLADMIARSGVEDAFSFSLKVNPGLGEDYQIIAKGGDFSDIANFDALCAAGRSKAINVADGANFVNIILITRMTDNHSRPVEIYVTLKAIQKPDSITAYHLIASMFPNLKFQAVGEKIGFSERKKLAEQNIIPHPPVKHQPGSK